MTGIDGASHDPFDPPLHARLGGGFDLVDNEIHGMTESNDINRRSHVGLRVLISISAG